MNKFLILIAAFLCAIQFTNAQTEKGNHTLGLNVTYSGSRYSDNYFDANSETSSGTARNSYFTVGPLYSYFIADRVDLGASFSLTSSSNSSKPVDPRFTGNKYYNKNYDAIVYLRKYFLYANKIGIRTGPYAGYTWANQGYGTTDNQPDVNTSNGKTHGYEAGARLEAVYFPLKKLGISAMIANFEFEHFTGKTISNNNSTIERTDGNNINFSFVNNGLGLSLFYVFGK